MDTHKVPVHLDTQDTFLWNLSFRQVLILFVGGGITYLVGTFDWSTPMTVLLCVLVGGLCLVVTLLVAFIRVRHRDLDQWLLVAFLYYSSPPRYLWSALKEQDRDNMPLRVGATSNMEEEEW